MGDFALVIGIEEYYQSDVFGTVMYAKRDAQEIAATLGKIGYQTELLLNQEATLGRILGALKKMAQTGKAGDTLALFYAGHGISEAGQNFLLPQDADSDVLQETSISLEKILKFLAASPSRKKLLFLDCCHEGLKLVPNPGGPQDSIDEKELADLFPKNSPTVLFTACSAGEKSYPSLNFKHSHWAFHLLHALNAGEPKLLKRGLLSSENLGEYLQKSVQRDLSLQSSTVRKQTPQRWGGGEKVPIADLNPLLEKKLAEKKKIEAGLDDATFEKISTGTIKSLSGFKKGHFIPSSSTSSSRRYVEESATAEIETEVKKVFNQVQASGKYKSREIDPSGGGVKTPDFHFSIDYIQNKKDPSEYIATAILGNFQDPAILNEDWFNKCFHGKFDSVVLVPKAGIDLNEVIRKAEDIDHLKVSTDPEKTTCTLSSAGWNGHIVVTSERLRFVFGGFHSPRELSETFSHLLRDLNACKITPLLE